MAPMIRTCFLNSNGIAGVLPAVLTPDPAGALPRRETFSCGEETHRDRSAPHPGFFFLPLSNAFLFFSIRRFCPEPVNRLKRYVELTDPVRVCSVRSQLAMPQDQRMSLMHEPDGHDCAGWYWRRQQRR
jgi:hypothetical protein